MNIKYVLEFKRLNYATVDVCTFLCCIYHFIFQHNIFNTMQEVSSVYKIFKIIQISGK